MYTFTHEEFRGKIAVKASFFRKNRKEEIGKKAINRTMKKNKMVFIESLFEFA